MERIHYQNLPSLDVYKFVLAKSRGLGGLSTMVILNRGTSQVPVLTKTSINFSICKIGPAANGYLVLRVRTPHAPLSHFPGGSFNYYLYHEKLPRKSWKKLKADT